MTWTTHQALAIMASMALGMPLLATAAAWSGSIMPDIIDQKRAAFSLFNSQGKYNKVHRKGSHWFGWWLLLWIFAQGGYLGPLPDSLLGGLAFGALTHCLLDMCTTRGVPLLPIGSSRFSLKICSGGGLVEYAILGLCAFAFWTALRNGLIRIDLSLF